LLTLLNWLFWALIMQRVEFLLTESEKLYRDFLEIVKLAG